MSMIHTRVRLGDQLLDKLKVAAKKNGRTLTGEMRHRLDQSFDKAEAANNREKMVKDVVHLVLALTNQRKSDSDVKSA